LLRNYILLNSKRYLTIHPFMN